MSNEAKKRRTPSEWFRAAVVSGMSAGAVRAVVDWLLRNLPHGW